MLLTTLKVYSPSGRSRIGNDVWLGRNVIVTNYANIGNGVIAGAGTIITKDVPDYAFVVGAPARIIRYRYSPEEIAALNKIAWWDWQYRLHTKPSISAMSDHGCSTMGCDYLSYRQQPQAVAPANTNRHNVFAVFSHLYGHILYRPVHYG